MICEGTCNVVFLKFKAKARVGKGGEKKREKEKTSRGCRLPFLLRHAHFFALYCFRPLLSSFLFLSFGHRSSSSAMGEGLTRDDLERYGETIRTREQKREKETSIAVSLVVAALSFSFLSRPLSSLSFSLSKISPRKQADVLRAGEGAR